jgi:acyl-CoA synthetase (NDP forming)
MIAGAAADDYERAMLTLAESGDVDALIVIFTPPLVTRAAQVVRAIHGATESLRRRLPVLSVFMSKDSTPHVVRHGGVAIPHYPFPEDAARALARAASYADWRATPEEPAPVLQGIDRDRAAAVVASALAAEPGWMAPQAVHELLACYGIPLVKTVIAGSPHEAGRAAAKLGSDIALKAIVPGLVHKSDAGAVRLRLHGARTVEAAAAAMEKAFEAEGRPPSGYEVQRMAGAGVEMIVGVVQDQHFGPVLACGAGGAATELVKDVEVRITPITAGEASRMVRALKTFPLLDGFRGAPKADVAALEDVLLRVSALVEAQPEIAEMDLNPLIVSADGALAVDARVRLEPGMPKKPLAVR